MKKQPYRPSVVVAATVLIVVTSLLLVEGLARLASSNEVLVARIAGAILSNSGSSAHLDPYEMADDIYYNHWRLKPGTEIELSRLANYKRAAGKFIMFDALQRTLIPGQGDKIGIRINDQGFKGPPIRANRGNPRILAVGDSTTFGSGPFDYPLFLHKALEKLGFDAEVINGGVEGYSPRNMILELDHYLSVRPDIVLIYAGWNSIFSDVSHTSFLARHSVAYRLIWRVVNSLRYKAIKSSAEAMALLNRPKKPDPAAPEITALDSYVPPSIEKIAFLAEHFREAGAKPVILTLPGLFTLTTPLDERALGNGHLPRQTDNPYVLAKLTARYNDALRELAKEQGYQLVDLATWSLKAFQPRSYYYTDSVHMATWGMELVGQHLAEVLASDITAESQK